MTRSARTRRARVAPSRPVAVAALATLALVAPVAGQAGATGTTPDEDPGTEPGLTILLDEVDPVVAEPGEPVTLHGRVVNPTDTPARVTTLTAHASRAPLGSRAELADWLDGSVDRETSWILGDDTVGPVVPAGGEVEFSLAVRGSTLEELPPAPGALAIRLATGASAQDPVESSGDVDRGPVDEPRVELRTVLTSTGSSAVDTPLEVSWVVPLTLPPDPDLVNPEVRAHTAAWLEAVGPQSLVQDWLGHLSVPGVTYLVDPALLSPQRPAASLASVSPGPAGGGEEVPSASPTETGQDSSPGPTTTPGDSPQETSGPAPVPAPAPAPAPVDDPAATTAPADDEATTGQPGDDAADDGSADAAALALALRLLRAELAGHPDDDLWWLPTDDPDLARLIGPAGPAQERAAELVARPPASSPAEATRMLGQGRSGVAWPVLDGPTGADVDRLEQLWGDREDGTALRVVLVPRESFTASSAAGPNRGAVPLADSEVVALGVDSWSSALLAASSTDAEAHGAGAAAQHLLAHTLGTYLEAPGTARTLVVAPPRGTPAPTAVLDQLSAGWQDATWVASAPASRVVDDATGTSPVQLTGTPPQEAVLGDLAGLLTAPPSPVDEGLSNALGRLQDDLEGLSEMLVDTGPLRSWTPVVDGLWSTRWRGDPGGWADVWWRVRSDVRATREAVHVTPSNVNFLAENGTIQVTVVNDLPIGVQDVRLRISPDNGRLQVMEQPEPVDIGPGSRATVPFRARAITSGAVTLSTELSTPGGISLGQDEQLSVRVQPPGVWIYWVLGGLAGVILLLGLARGLRSGPRATASSTTARPAAEESGGGTAYPGPAPSPGKEST